MQKILTIHYLYLIPLVTSALVSIRSFKAGWPKVLRIFSYLLLATLLFEVLAVSWKWGLHESPYWSYKPWNIWLYDIFTVFKLLFYLYFFSLILQSSFVRKMLRHSLLPVLLLSSCEILLIKAAWEPNAVTLVIGNIIIVSLCLLFFKEVMDRSDIAATPDTRLLLIAIGAFLYHSVTTPFFIYLNFLNYQPSSLFLDFISINHAANIIMYSLFTTVFLCKSSFQM